MFKSVLIANRGEIACRIIRTCKKLGIRSIAVFAEADRHALHVQMADEAVYIGPSVPAQSYLLIENIIDAAQRTGAEAVHPGYGFLSENAGLAQALQQASIGFIGPDASCIASMGDKIESKRLAEAAGVPGVPGYSGDDQCDEVLIEAAEKIGFPVMVKASAGGGGKGMRRVFVRDELEEAIGLARKEAQVSFGDDRLLVEKLIQRPRHLEVQIAGDSHGNVVHLLERDCSVQRNNQKVLEEAPAPNLSDTVRKKLFERAIKLAKAINYNSLGTVEFIMNEGDDEPAFLEMNTRLQVEHPVTEMITGLDLVELQIRIAAGESIGFPQSAVQANGHAIEARITAERPEQGFLPDIGRLHHVCWPGQLRVDTGVEAGSEVSQFYDSMLAKVIAHGPNREEACDRLIKGLGETAIIGVETNISFLKDCVEAPDFYQGKATTAFLDEVFPGGWKMQATDNLAPMAAAIWQALAARDLPYQGLRLLAGSGHKARSWLTVLAGEAEPIELVVTGDSGIYEVSVGSEPSHEITVLELTGHEALLLIKGRRSRVIFAQQGDDFYLAQAGQTQKFTILPSVDYAGTVGQGGAAGGDIKSDMPGAVSEVLVTEGDMLDKHQPVLVIESMKLLITLKAPIAGKVFGLNVKPGDLVSAGDLLASIELEE